ncbi:unnamed protein product [Citrullus colocynthis]|uniref:Uncharacterized protein n=1 Tax=Citrullus colocynthis TaxID=252529 RepID=A0ABP0Y5U3_9ROSI
MDKRHIRSIWGVVEVSIRTKINPMTDPFKETNNQLDSQNEHSPQHLSSHAPRDNLSTHQISKSQWNIDLDRNLPQDPIQNRDLKVSPKAPAKLFNSSRFLNLGHR